MILPLPAAVLVDHPFDIYTGEVRAYVRQDAPVWGIAAVFMAFGILSLVLYGLRNRKEKGFLWFAVFSGAYGLQLLLSSDVFHFTMTVEKAQRLKWNYPEWAVNYGLLPFAVLFLGEVFPEWNRVLLRRLVVVLSIFAAVALGADIALHRAGSLRLPYYAIVVLGLIAALRVIPARANGGYGRWLRITGVAFIASVLVENAKFVSAGSFSVRLQIIEALALICWLGALVAFSTGIAERGSGRR
jgi:hypothetical protein